MAQSEVIDVLHRFYEAESVYIESEDKNFDVVAAVLHPECVMLQPDSLPYGGAWRGHEGFQEWMIAFDEVWSALAVTDPRFYPAGPDVVFVRSTARGTARVNGVELTWPLLQMITVRDGLILEIQPFYWDTASIVAAVSA